MTILNDSFTIIQNKNVGNKQYFTYFDIKSIPCFLFLITRDDNLNSLHDPMTNHSDKERKRPS